MLDNLEFIFFLRKQTCGGDTNPDERLSNMIIIVKANPVFLKLIEL